MLETALTAAFIALICSFGAHFLLTWETRRQLRDLSEQWEALNERITAEQKRRAAGASVAARGLHPSDAAAIAAISKAGGPHAAHASASDDFPAWFDGFSRK